MNHLQSLCDLIQRFSTNVYKIEIHRSETGCYFGRSYAKDQTERTLELNVNSYTHSAFNPMSRGFDPLHIMSASVTYCGPNVMDYHILDSVEFSGTKALQGLIGWLMTNADTKIFMRETSTK